MANKVAIPDNADEAALMVLTGVAWLKQHAPERLTGEECRKDAERYRWLRARLQGNGCDQLDALDAVLREDAQQMDAAIDEELQADRLAAVGAA